MSADRIPYILETPSDEMENAEVLLQDLENLIYEILPPEIAEAAYTAALEHLLKVLGGEALLATDQLPERVMYRSRVR